MGREPFMVRGLFMVLELTIREHTIHGLTIHGLTMVLAGRACKDKPIRLVLAAIPGGEAIFRAVRRETALRPTR
jgi:hypothetical protein